MNGKVINNLRRNVKPRIKKLSSCKKAISILLIASICFPMLMVSQESDTAFVAESKAATLKYLKSEALLEKEKRDNRIFIEDHKIDLSTYKEAIVLVKTRIRSDADMEKGHNVANVEMGSVVKIYKFYKRDKSWAVKHNNKWGFLPESVLQEL